MNTYLQENCEHLAGEYIVDNGEMAGSIQQIGVCPDCGLVYFERWYRPENSEFRHLGEYWYTDVHPVWHERILKIATENLLSQIDQIKELTAEKSAATGRAITAEKRLNAVKGVVMRQFQQFAESAAEVIEKMAVQGTHRDRNESTLTAIQYFGSFLKNIHGTAHDLIDLCALKPVSQDVDDIPF